MSDIPFIA